MIIKKRLLPKRRLPPKQAPALGRRRQEREVGINPPVDLLPGKRRKKRLKVLYRA